MLLPVILLATAIANPSSQPLPVKQANPATAREEQAIQGIKFLNRSQQTLYAERGRFALASNVITGWPQLTDSYKYLVRGTDRMGIQVAEPLAANLRSVVGAVIPNAQGMPIAIVCRALTPGRPAPEPIAQNGRLTCAAGTELVP